MKQEKYELVPAKHFRVTRATEGRRTMMMQNFGLEKLEKDKQDQSKLKDLGSLLHSSSDSKLNEESITPYVIINKTDCTFIVKRLFEKNGKELFNQDNLKKMTKEQMLTLLKHQSSDVQKNRLINYFELKPGEIIEYMVDYNNSNQAFDRKENVFDELQSPALFAQDQYQGKAQGIVSSIDLDTDVHNDTIGEYKSEYIKIQFETSSSEVTHNLAKFGIARDIKKIDLNENGYRSHILREGQYMEKVFYGVRLIDFKKVFTVRSQYQLINFTNYDYLIHFRFKTYSVVKYLEKGESLPLTMRFDDSMIQFKMIDQDSNPECYEQSKHEQSKTAKKQQLPEELRAQSEDVVDFSDPRYKYQNWTKLIPPFYLKERLKVDGCCFLTNNISKFTFFKKTRADHFEKIIDIALMPPMVVKNCLPFKIKLSFIDSSNVPKTEEFELNEEKSLVCFKMDTSIEVELDIQGFQTTTVMLFNLDNYLQTETVIDLEDTQGRRTKIYTSISRQNSGQKTVFYCKRLLVDCLDSNIEYFFRQPQKSLFGANVDEIMRTMIPFVNNQDLQLKICIIPFQFEKVYVALRDEYLEETNEINIEDMNIQGSFKLENKEKEFNYSYCTQMYLATQDQSLYSKITTINPFYILVNQSNYTILVEQAEYKQPSDELDLQLPIIL